MGTTLNIKKELANLQIHHDFLKQMKIKQNIDILQNNIKQDLEARKLSPEEKLKRMRPHHSIIIKDTPQAPSEIKKLIRMDTLQHGGHFGQIRSVDKQVDFSVDNN